MNASSARILRGSASIQPIVDVLLGPAMIALALLFSLLMPVRVHAQTVGGAAADFVYQRSMARIVSGTAAGLQASSGTTMNIINAGKIVGSFAVTEKRLIDIASLAKFARASTIPGLVALGGGYLLQYGLQKCADGSWCKAGQTDPTKPQPYLSANGYYTGAYDKSFMSSDPASVCVHDKDAPGSPYAGKTFIVFDHIQPPASGNSQSCYLKNTQNNVVFNFANYQPQTGCAPGDTLSSGVCYPAGYVQPQPVVATDADIESSWQQAMKANPFLQEKVWGFEDQTTQNQQWADALAQLATVAAPTSVAVTDPATSTTNSSGTTKVERTCTYTATANADPATQKDQPASAGTSCVTKTTNPDGTVKTETTTTDAAPKGGASAPQKVDIDTCGLPGKPACKIDETGTPTDQKTDTATSTSQAADNAMKQQTDALKNALDGTKPETNWFNWLPVIPRSDCKPMTVDALGNPVSVDWCPAVDFMKVLSTVAWAFTIMGGCIAEVKDALNGA